MEPLTPRELSILECLARYLTRDEIAAECFISPHTVKTHVRHICEKLGAPTGRMAVRLAIATGLLEVTCSIRS